MALRQWHLLPSLGQFLIPLQRHAKLGPLGLSCQGLRLHLLVGNARAQVLYLRASSGPVKVSALRFAHNDSNCWSCLIGPNSTSSSARRHSPGL